MNLRTKLRRKQNRKRISISRPSRASQRPSIQSYSRRSFSKPKRSPSIKHELQVALRKLELCESRLMTLGQVTGPVTGPAIVLEKEALRLYGKPYARLMKGQQEYLRGLQKM